MDEDKNNGKYQFLMEKETLEGLELIPTYLKISQILLLQYDEFLHLIDKFNQTLNLFTNDEPYLIQFSIVPESDSTMLWKLFIRIKCSKIARADQSVSDEILLNLNQFLSVYQSLTEQLLLLEQNPSNNLINSTEQYYSICSTRTLSFPGFDTNECCICMDNQVNLVLSCAHKICEQCFQRWSAQTSTREYQTCPICRSDVNIDNGFILTEIPKSDNVKKTLMESILSLPIDKTKSKNDE